LKKKSQRQARRVDKLKEAIEGLWSREKLHEERCDELD